MVFVVHMILLDDYCLIYQQIEYNTKEFLDKKCQLPTQLPTRPVIIIDNQDNKLEQGHYHIQEIMPAKMKQNIVKTNLLLQNLGLFALRMMFQYSIKFISKYVVSFNTLHKVGLAVHFSRETHCSSSTVYGNKYSVCVA